MSWITIWIVALFATASCHQEGVKILNFYQRDANLHMVKGEISTVVVDVVKENFDDNVSVLLHASLDVSNVVVLTIPTSWTLSQKTTSFPIEIEGKLPGVVVLSLNITTEDQAVQIRTPTQNALLYRIRIGKFYYAQLLSQLIGWIYVIVWNISSYPQLIKNFRRRSVVGIHLDYLSKQIYKSINYDTMLYSNGLQVITPLGIPFTLCTILPCTFRWWFKRNTDTDIHLVDHQSNSTIYFFLLMLPFVAT